MRRTGAEGVCGGGSQAGKAWGIHAQGFLKWEAGLNPGGERAAACAGGVKRVRTRLGKVGLSGCGRGLARWGLAGADEAWQGRV